MKTKSNMTNIEDKIDDFSLSDFECQSPFCSEAQYDESKIKKFMLSLVEETRKEIIKQIRKMETSSYTLEGAYINENIDFICKKLKKSSIKRKIK
jgi:hypothetical protein